jgi:L,D-transpeptidase-like protein
MRSARCEFRPDFRLQIVLALDQAKGPHGGRWVELSLPGRPNGGRGWVPRAAVELHRVQRRTVILRGARQLQVRRISDGGILLQALIAVGKPGAETPARPELLRGRPLRPEQSVPRHLRPRDERVLAPERGPGGGVVGIHGTDEPQLIGQAVSHGCIRMFNRDLERLQRLAPLGTPIDMLP